jgi:hypothetical protein
MPTADWYYIQADVLRGRAEACRQLAQRLDGAALFDLHKYSGDLTWDCPAGDEFDRLLSTYRADLQDAIDALLTNALGFSGDADDYERRGAAALNSELGGSQPIS